MFDFVILSFVMVACRPNITDLLHMEVCNDQVLVKYIVHINISSHNTHYNTKIIGRNSSINDVYLESAQTKPIESMLNLENTITIKLANTYQKYI